MQRFASRLVQSFGIIALFLGAALLGTATGVLFAFVGDLPQISALDDYSPSTITRVLGRDGSVVGEFATERRRSSPTSRFPKSCATRSSRPRTASSSATAASASRASSSRSCKDVVYQRALGRQHAHAAARAQAVPDRRHDARNARSRKRCSRSRSRSGTRSRKSSRCTATRCPGATARTASRRRRSSTSPSPAKDLTLDEAAMIAGIIQSNVRQSPYVNMQAAMRRRNYTLDRMVDEGFITRGRGRRRQEAADRHARRSRRRRRRSRRTSSRPSACTSKNGTARRRSTKTASS